MHFGGNVRKPGGHFFTFADVDACCFGCVCVFNSKLDCSRIIDVGVAFHTLAFSENATYQNIPSPDPRPELRLTIRPLNYVFTAVDFEAYEFSRSYIFRDPRIARAALLAGGILWRLAIEEVVPDLVLDGPDPLSTQLGIGFRLRDEKDGYVYMDDQLTAVEVGSIVGMYFEKSEQHRIKWDRDTCPTWWPLPAYFKGSALDYPVWTPVAENWYQSLRRQDTLTKAGQGLAHFFEELG
uniref:Candidapepsin-5 (Aspartate protease 5) (Secreted aspartic protease 5)) n=1 Tax=Ganoderma boninense TaxID=34458 RepID=A0A5K1K8V7_9APHY|nr:Candidapepsin-5 (EC (ACP 5) (Aspartate protease 5) (Secreted aspartic protease 5) [Ganoderma boninense]